ncbi:MAG: V-type ATP synthase subunit F, partial [Candidatus Methanofastidiosia archaeon]
MEFAVVGDESFMIGFKVAGIKKNLLSQTPKEYEENINKLLDDPKVGIIVVPDKALADLSPFLKKRIEETTRPVLFPIGDKRNIDIKNQIIKI